MHVEVVIDPISDHAARIEAGGVRGVTSTLSSFVALPVLSDLTTASLAVHSTTAVGRAV